MKIKDMNGRTELFKALDAAFNHEYRVFVRGMIKENKRRNKRLLRAIGKIKGEQFVSDVESLMKVTGNKNNLISIVRKPVGASFKDHRYSTIPIFWVTTTSICIEVKDNRWLLFHHIVNSEWERGVSWSM